MLCTWRKSYDIPINMTNKKSATPQESWKFSTDLTKILNVSIFQACQGSVSQLQDRRICILFSNSPCNHQLITCLHSTPWRLPHTVYTQKMLEQDEMAWPSDFSSSLNPCHYNFSQSTHRTTAEESFLRCAQRPGQLISPTDRRQPTATCQRVMYSSSGSQIQDLKTVQLYQSKRMIAKQLQSGVATLHLSCIGHCPPHLHQVVHSNNEQSILQFKPQISQIRSSLLIIC